MSKIPIVLFFSTLALVGTVGVLQGRDQRVVMRNCRIIGDRIECHEPNPRAMNLLPTPKEYVELFKETAHLTMQVVVTLIVLVAALFVVLSKRYAPRDKNWAYGALGTVLGFWLKP